MRSSLALKMPLLSCVVLLFCWQLPLFSSAPIKKELKAISTKLDELSKKLEEMIKHAKHGNGDEPQTKMPQMMASLGEKLGKIVPFCALELPKIGSMSSAAVARVKRLEPRSFCTNPADGTNIGVEMAKKFWHLDFEQFVEQRNTMVKELKEMEQRMDAVAENVNGKRVQGVIEIIRESKKHVTEELNDKYTNIFSPLKHVEKALNWLLEKFFKRPPANESVDDQVARFRAEADQLASEATILEFLDNNHMFQRTYDLSNEFQEELSKTVKMLALYKAKAGPALAKEKENMQNEHQLLQTKTLAGCTVEAVELGKELAIYLDQKYKDDRLVKIAYQRAKAGLARLGIAEPTSEHKANALLSGGVEGEQRLLGQFGHASPLDHFALDLLVNSARLYEYYDEILGEDEDAGKLTD